MMKTVTRADFPNKEMPDVRKPVPLTRRYSKTEFERLAAGHLSRDMDDKWCSFFESPWLYLHRSWTGIRIYNVKLEVTGDGCEVVEALVNCDPMETGSGPGGFQRPELLAVILDGLAGRDLGVAWRRFDEGTILG